uniref:Uncharacterized protein n=1 Tax=Glossina austeni TaxID=7395 RepID=A0A1A9VL67_GLOAU
MFLTSRNIACAPLGICPGYERVLPPMRKYFLATSVRERSMCAIGCMVSMITVWDFDMQDSLEPTFSLGSKTKYSKKLIEGCNHTDAVLDFSWNRHYEHILAIHQYCGIMLDLHPNPNTITTFEEKVQ